jgi:hypothetical protein
MIMLAGRRGHSNVPFLWACLTEAGERSYDRSQGEEMNRLLSGLLTVESLLLLFATCFADRFGYYPIVAAVIGFGVAAMPFVPAIVRAAVARLYHRRWSQFSLRSLLILTAVVAVAAGRLGQKFERKHKERETVAAILKQGGTVWYNDRVGGPSSRRRSPAGPEWLRELLGEYFFAEVDVVYLPNPPGNATLANLAELPRLEKLWVHRTDDAKLAEIRRALPNCPVVGH